MTYEEMQALAEKIASKIDGELLPFAAGDNPEIMVTIDDVDVALGITVV